MTRQQHMTMTQQRLQQWVEGICSFGPRATSVWHDTDGDRLDANTLDAARDWLVDQVRQLGQWHTDIQPFTTPDGEACNIEIRHHDAPAEPPGKVLLIGAHYDTWRETPGADDNASAVAVLLHMLEELHNNVAVVDGHIRFVLFANEEPPNFQSPYMGSLQHAQLCKTRGWSVEMLCLESLGYFSDEPNSQQSLGGFDVPEEMEMLGDRLLGTVGDFVAFEADDKSAELLQRLLAGYDAADAPPLRRVGEALSQDICTGLSDHWSYWQMGYPAVMVTDTALLRNPHYHSPSDTPDTLDYRRHAIAAARLTEAVRHAAQSSK